MNNTTHDIMELNRLVAMHVRQVIDHIVDRAFAANWAVAVLKSTPTISFASDHGALVEYALTRLADDDWTNDDEFWPELENIDALLNKAYKGDVSLP